jgi:hypothetical protein
MKKEPARSVSLDGSDFIWTQDMDTHLCSGSFYWGAINTELNKYDVTAKSPAARFSPPFRG